MSVQCTVQYASSTQLMQRSHCSRGKDAMQVWPLVYATSKLPLSSRHRCALRRLVCRASPGFWVLSTHGKHPEGVRPQKSAGWQLGLQSHRYIKPPFQTDAQTGVFATPGTWLTRRAALQVGNFLSDRPSSRVLAPPGGASQVFLGSSDAGHQPGQARPSDRNTLELSSRLHVLKIPREILTNQT